MIRAFRPALAAIAGLFLLGSAATPPAFAADKAPPVFQRDRVWPQSFSDLKPDPSVRYGTLANGMRYAIMHNATPAGQASVRLRIGAGSFYETDAQQGLAHYLEHMAFDGSTNVPKGEMVRILERVGMAFGADTNASTDWTETVYRLDLPNTSDQVVDTALMLMRETASELTISQEAVDQERGVVLSEERARDTPPYRVFKERLGFVLKDQLAPRRFPIGTLEVLKSAQRDQIAAFYSSFYRPEFATLVIVGDFDAAAMEAKVRARFEDWRNKAPAPADPDLGRQAKRDPAVKLLVEPGGQLLIQLAWLQRLDETPDSEAKQRRDTVEQIGFAILNRRLERLARAEAPPFIGAGASRSDEMRSATVATLSVNAAPDKWREGLTAAEETRRRLLQYGVRQDEIDREVAESRVILQTQVQGAATRRTPSLAAQLLQSIDDGEVFTTPADDLALYERAVQGLAPDKVLDALKEAFRGDGPLLFMATPNPIEGGEAAVSAALAAASSSKLAAPAAEVAKTWTHTSFGTPGTVAETRHIIDLDTHFFRFANGVRLTVKPTKFRDDQVLVSVRFGYGMLEMAKDRTPPWGVGAAFIEGGLSDLTAEEMDAILVSKIYGADLNVGEDAFSLNGTTRPEDLETQLQVLAAYMTAPGWRPAGFQRMRTYGLTLHRQLEATPSGVMRRDLQELMHDGDRRWRFPSRAEIEDGKPDQVRAFLEGPLARGPIEIIITGDIGVDEAVELTGATFGALPRRTAYPDAPAAGGQVHVPSPARVARTHTGRADQAIAYMAWPTQGFFADPQKARELRLVQLVLNLRLIDRIRIAQGATYSPSTGFEASTAFPTYGYISSSVEIPPARIDGFFADVDAIAADLRTKEVTADELDRARKPRIEALERAKQTNEYWLGQLAGAQGDPRRLDAIRASIAGLERVTPADLKRAAQQYLVDGKEWRFTVQAK